MANNASPLSQITAPSDYQSSGRQHVFPSLESLRWFIRTQRTELVNRGALLKLGGKVMLDAAAMDDAVVALAREAASRSEAAR